MPENKSPTPRTKLFCVIFLSLFAVSAFFIRLDTFKKTKKRSLDEVVYYNLGLNLEKDIRNYNSIGIANFWRKEGRVIPLYFTQPLFKHPPFFSFLIAASFKIFGTDPVAAEYVSLLFGVLLIPLIYLFGTLTFNRAVGLLSAFFLFIDPVSIICSQKVWMDTLLTFCIFLSIYLFIYAHKYRKDSFYLYSGIASGLALLTKYPGILPVFIIVIFTSLYHRELLKKKQVILGLLIPFVMFLPWLYWNYLVYGAHFVFKHLTLHNFSIIHTRVKAVLSFCLLLIIISLTAVFRAGLIKEKIVRKIAALKLPGWLNAKNIKLAVGLTAVALLHRSFLQSIQLDFLPANSEFSGLFAYEPRTFYFGKLLQFSLLYFFAFLSFFISSRRENAYTPLIKISALVILIFFTAWGNFQSRYILPGIPFLILLASDTWLKILLRSWYHPDVRIKYCGRFVIIFSGIVILWRSYHINSILSATNNMAYF